MEHEYKKLCKKYKIKSIIDEMEEDYKKIERDNQAKKYLTFCLISIISSYSYYIYIKNEW